MGQMVFWRVFQAVGACTGPMLARTMVRDLYTRTQAARMLSTLTVIMAIAPIAGPLVGGQIMRWGSWHVIFWMLAFIAGGMLVALRQLPETLPLDRRATTPALGAFGDYRILLSNWVFMRYVLCVTLYYIGIYAFLAGSPRIYIDYFHVAPEHYGWLFGMNMVGMMGVSVINRRLVGRFGLDALLRTATAVAATSMLVCFLLVMWGVAGLPGIVVPIFVFFSMNGIIAATATAAALDGVPRHLAGAATALIGSLQYGSGIGPTLLLAMLDDGTPRSFITVMATFAIAAALMAAYLARRSGNPGQ